MDRQLTVRDYIAFFGMVVGMFMPILDIQIVVSSLSVISASLGANQDEMSWVQTAYLIAEVIMIPATGFLARCFSIRILFSAATFLFTLMSILCALAWNIESMIIFRALQGFFGGAMIPSVFSIIFSVFRGDKRMKIGIVIGLVVTLAPTFGPIIGGYITEAISWRMMFLINVVPGILVFCAAYFHIGFDKPNLKLLKDFDLLGFLLMAVGLGTLEYMLEEGTRLHWFESHEIINLFTISLVCIISFIFREMTYKNPIIYLSVFQNRNFTLGCIAAFILGIGLFGVVFLTPLFLYVIGGLNTSEIGQVMMVTGFGQFIAAPFSSWARKYFSFKHMLYGGFTGFAIGCYMGGFLTPEAKFDELMIPQFIRGFSLMFCFVPIAEIVFSTLDKSEVKNASVLYNLIRNLGGALGLAVMNTLIITERTIYMEYLSENLHKSDIHIWDFFEKLSFLFGSKALDTNIFTYEFLGKLIYRDAMIIAINNVFIYIATLFIWGLACVYFVEEKVDDAKK